MHPTHATDDAGVPRTAIAPPQVAAPACPPVPSGAFGGAIDTDFYRWLAGIGEDDAGAGAAVAALILHTLRHLVEAPHAGASLVPRVPAVIPQLLHSLRDENLTSTDLARQLGRDVVLVAAVVREANSPYYRPAVPINTIEGAVMLLGQNGLRMLLARVAFRPIISMQAGRYAKLVAPQVWRQSALCAMAAAALAPALDADPFEAYLAGLMQNVGLIVAFRMIDQTHTGACLPRSDDFVERLFFQSRALSAGIATLWDFPVTVTAAIALAGDPQAPALAKVLATADRISKLRLLVEAGRLDPAADPALLQGLDRAALAAFEKLTTEEH